MKLLDVFLALALTLAGFSTIITIIMEAFFRTLRMRRKNLEKTINLLLQESKKAKLFKFTDAQVEKIKNSIICNPTQANSKCDKFDKVSLGHVMCQILEDDDVKRMCLQSSRLEKAVRTEMNRLARKYEEFGSSMSAAYKRNAQFWSLLIGVIFALLVNVDGLRLLQAFRADAELTAEVIAKQGSMEDDFEELKQGSEQYKNAQVEVDKWQAQVDELLAAFESESDQDNGVNSQVLATAQQNLNNAKEKVADFDSPEALAEMVKEAEGNLISLIELGIPIGWNFYPSCPYQADEAAWDNSHPDCRTLASAVREQCAKPFKSCDAILPRIWTSIVITPQTFITWLFSVIATGLLIGLGAPFWFDVAKRLAAIRQGLRQVTSSGENRMSARDANGEPEKRKEIVNQAIDDAIAEAKVSPPPLLNNGAGDIARKAADEIIKSKPKPGNNV